VLPLSRRTLSDRLLERGRYPNCLSSPPRLLVTYRAGRWLTRQIGKNGRSVQEIANELGCDRHAVNDALLRYGKALLNDPNRFGIVEAFGLNEVLFAREGC
jgi:hypothetical protein